MPYFSHGENNIFFEDIGSGVPIVFIHPPAMGRKVFFYQKKLSKHFRVLLPDLSGHGDTTGPAGNVSISGFANEIKGLLDFLEIECAAVCGYSSGGLVAQEFALQYPDRSLAVILSGGFPQVLSPAFKYEHMIGMYFVKHAPDFLRYLIAISHTDDKELQDGIIHHMKKANRKTWFDFYEKSLHFSCLDRLHHLQAPLLLFYGSRDIVNQHVRAYKKHTNCQISIIKNESHQLPTKKWELFNQMITGFLMEKVPERSF
ncbi:alpha/beta fold hydrolase [Bacillus methanolicus]|uniref:AB hydrolase superfamily protein YvaM n=1 Tax=Bacillus methanolicus (strain MGA3 / ATCC 53907) TaxID=796606 RepID=I3E9A3_BACMM|nr:alpha/beta hydrolase [Bacillus methanolicus]AIE60326.1 AB hydrolase superfamily protein YvaM [Bacillus methanolicus MGA3]EIJ83074.1 protein YvaM [Bacillus methanolicus MGA3]